MIRRPNKWVASIILTAILFGGALAFNRFLVESTFGCAERGQTEEQQQECDQQNQYAYENARLQQILLPTSLVVHQMAKSNGVPPSSLVQQILLYSNALIYFLLSEWIVSVLYRRLPPNKPHGSQRTDTTPD